MTPGTQADRPGRAPRPATLLAGLAMLGVAAGIAVFALARLVVRPSLHVVQMQPEAGSLGTVRILSPPRPAPPLHFTDATGRPMTLDALHGRAVVLNLWATWCVPCRNEMPSLDRLQARLGGPGFLVLPLSIDRQGAAVVGPFYRELGLTALGVYLDQTGKATSLVDASGIPTTLLIDADGREVARVMGAAAWDGPAMVAAIRRLLLPAPGPPPRPVTDPPQGAN